MKIQKLFLILIISYCALILRFYLDNIVFISLIASLIYGILIAKKLIIDSNKYIFISFFSSFTTFSGFVTIFFQMFINGKFLQFFLLVNLLLFINLVIMYLGFFIGKRFRK